MGYLLHIVLALGVLAGVESGTHMDWELPLGVAALCVVPHALAALDRRLFLRGRFRIAGLVYVALGWAPLAAFALAQAVFGWNATLERWLGRPPTILGWPDPATLLALAPFIVYSLLAIDARARISDARRAEIQRVRLFQARMFFSGLAPFVLFLLLTWAVGLDLGVRANIEHVGLWGGAFALSMLALSALLLPSLLRNTWDASPMPANATRQMLEGFAQGIRFRCRELLVWNTGHQMANAAVVGVGSNLRVVFFSDALLAQLPPRELLAVFAHEIGHVARHHVVVFIAWALAVFLGFDLLIEAVQPPSDVWIWCGFAAVLIAWYFGFGFLSRRAELEADLFAIELTGDLEGMTHALELVGSPHTRGIGSWRHFSTERRIAFLRRATELPAIARRLKTSLKLAAWLGITLAVLAIGLEVRALMRAYPRDRVTAALTLGDYTAARERLGAFEGADADLTRRVKRGAELYANGDRGVERLTVAALEALPRGDREAAGDYLYLAQLRGRKGLDEAVDKLDNGATNNEVFVALDHALKESSRTGSR